jgi:hypothetical protein
MRTKITFLAAAALAAGLASSMAQSNVYSVNIVGYINVPLAANTEYLLANPLDNGTNDLISIDNGALPNKTVVNTFNGTGFTAANKTKGTWNIDPAIGPGVGFFVTPAGATTLTFIGQAPVSNNYVLGTAEVLVGPLLPIAGTLTDAGANTLNLGGALPNKSVINQFNGTGFTAANKTKGTWNVNLSIPVAGGFFVTPASATTWTQYLQ